LTTVIGNDCHRLLVVAGEHTFDRIAFSALKTDPVAEAEFKHLGVCPHLSKETEAFDYPMVQVDEFSFAHPINIDLRHLCHRWLSETADADDLAVVRPIG
jgi:hypothetical protein